MSLKQLRDFVTHEMKLRAIFLQASAKTKNKNSKNKLINLAKCFFFNSAKTTVY